MRHHRLASALAVVGIALLLPVAALADDVLAGLDLFTTVEAVTHQNFSGPFTIPADFFGPGSDPFTGDVCLRGYPFHTSVDCPGVDLNDTDTIVRRLANASLPTIPSAATVPIELIELSLVSCSPITVTYSGGLNPEPWDLYVHPSPSTPSIGSMTIRHTQTNGGTFDSQINVVPLLTFIRQSDHLQRMLDGGLMGLSDQLGATGAPWRHDDTGGEPVLDPGCTSNFVGSYNGRRVTTTELGTLAAHGIRPADPRLKTPTMTTWGLLALALLVLAGGTVAVVRRGRATA